MSTHLRIQNSKIYNVKRTIQVEINLFVDY